MKRTMSAIAFFALAFAALAFLPQNVRADQLLDTYVARLSYADHHNSKGQPITTVAGIIRQDRANFHKFGQEDPEDTYDSVFGNAHNREVLESKLARGHCSASARRSILYGTPLIRVKIYRTHVDVTVLD